MSMIEEDLYFILTEKTSGECHEKVLSCDPGAGLEAYMKMYLWYSSTSGLALQERARMIMNPHVPQKEEDIAKALESWVTESNLLENHGDKYRLPPALKLTALKHQ